jgi:hypothetical protein
VSAIPRESRPVLKLIYVFVLILPAVVLAAGSILYLRRRELGWFRERERRRRERAVEELEAESARLDELIAREQESSARLGKRRQGPDS